MNIPPQIKVGGHTIKVIFRKMDEDTYGEFDQTTDTISLNENLSASQTGATLLHEILHVCNSELGDGINHIISESLAQQLFQVLKDNPLNFNE